MSMLRIQSTTLAVMGMMMLLSVQAQYVPQTPYLAGDDAPAWVKMMYSDDANPDAVRAAFDAHYADAPFVKNRDTQFYKRWMRNHEVLAPHPTRVYMDRHHAAA